MGCHSSKDDRSNLPPPEQSTLSAAEIENNIFLLLKDSFCANGPEAALVGQLLKEEALLKLANRVKKAEDAKRELAEISASDYFINKVALVDPVKGEIVVPYDRVMSVCSRMEIDEIHMLYERLRQVKVARLREAHGSDIIAILDDEGESTFSDCRENRRGGQRRSSRSGNNDSGPETQQQHPDNSFDPRNFGL
jgi:hypothetical protein